MRNLLWFDSSRALVALLIPILFTESSYPAEIPDSIHFESTEHQANLIELYTSQGCSSCPPAETRLNDLIDHPDLWTETIPLSFHVDYWDRLGWKDPFASRQNTQRQYLLKDKKQLSSVYTPAFVINGKEWRGFFRQEDWPDNSQERPGKLSVSINERRLTLSHPALGRDVKSFVALVGVGFETEVRSGENKDRSLKQDFVVIWYQENRDKHTATLPTISELPHANRYACIVWIAESENLRPIQAAATWLD